MDPPDPQRASAPDHGESATSDELIGQIVAGRYRVERLLGSGGMGSVYRAQHVHMRKTVALKVLHREMTYQPEMVARFEREAVAAARIDHPNVAAATDFGQLENGSFYLVLEFVEGQSLHALLAAEGALPAERALRITRQIALALRAAHAQGVVHRDLKPDNVMLVERPGKPDGVKVLDFGIAKLVQDESKSALTQIGAVFGTPEYMSPEQALGQTVDHRTDLYSLGIVLYQMLEGRAPFTGEEPVAVLVQQMTAPPPPLAASIPRAIAHLVMRLLEKDPAQRIQTAEDLLRELERLHGALLRAVAAPATPTERRGPSWVARAQASSDRARRYLRLRVAELGPGLRKTVKVGRHNLPRWVLLAAGAAVLALVTGINSARQSAPVAVAASSSGKRPAPRRSPPPRALPPSANLEPIRQRVAEIEALPVYKRTQADWIALGRGHAELGQNKESVIAYRELLSVRPSFAEDRQLLADLREAGHDPDAYRIVVNLCESALGRTGLDLLYQLWVDLRDDQDKANMTEVVLKKLEIMRLEASPALRIAIELAVLKSCSKLRDVVSRAVTYADSRALEGLEELEQRQGCGPQQTDDCFACLRADDLLDLAVARARTRRAPELGRTEAP